MQNEKRLYRNFCNELLDAQGSNVEAVLNNYVSDEVAWHGPHPLNTLRGKNEFAAGFWEPMSASFRNIERKDDILVCGDYQGESWVAAIGHYRGIFTEDWLNIPATGTMTPIRFGEFARIKNGRICEFRTLLDLVALCRQSGIDLLPPDSGSTRAVPAPASGDGVILEAQDPTSSARSLQLVEDMIDGLLEYDGHDLNSMGMERFWTADMRWYGPAGIGTTDGLNGFQENHQGPFLKAFPDRYAAPHSALLAEGDYVCVTGWPSVVGTHKGSYLGVQATGKQVGMRVMDFWRNENGQLAENWVLIDMIDLFLQLGVDLLADSLE